MRPAQSLRETEASIPFDLKLAPELRALPFVSDGTKRTVQDMLKLVAKAGEPAPFVAQNPNPVFIFGSFTSMHDSDFFTLDGEGGGLGLRVVEVRKRGGANVFDDMITVGRARNNDVQLRERSVSKFHAYLKRDGESLAIVDAGSTYGTQVNGKPLGSRDWAQRQPLRSGDLVLLGRLELTYYEPAELYEVLNKALSQGEA